MKTEEVQYAQHNNLSLGRLIIKRSGNPNPKHGNGKLKILAYYFENDYRGLVMGIHISKGEFALAVKEGMEDAGAIFATINKDPDTKVATPYSLLEKKDAQEMVSQHIRDLSKKHINENAKIKKKKILQKKIDQCENLRRMLTNTNVLGNNYNAIRSRAKLLFHFFGENGLSTEIIQQFKEIDLDFKDNEVAKQSGLIDGSKGALSEKKRKENTTNSTAAATNKATSRKKQKIVKDTANDGKDGTAEKKEIYGQLENTGTKNVRTEDNATPKVQEENVTEESKDGKLDNNIESAAGLDLLRMMHQIHQQGGGCMQDTYNELGLVGMMHDNKEAVAQIKADGRKDQVFSRISRMIANTTPKMV